MSESKLKKQESIRMGTHGEIYGSWMSNFVFYMLGGLCAAALVIAVVFFAVFHVKIVGIIFAVITAALIIFIALCVWIRRQYAFNGGAIMQKVHQTVIAQLDYDGTGTLLDVGCGAGPLGIRAALTWPAIRVVGIDYYGSQFDYSPEVCAKNAELEGVGERCSFQKGDATHLEFEDESMDAVVSAYVYHNVMGSNDKQALLLETLRVLKKGGSFAIIDSMKPEMYGDMEAFAEKLRGMGYQEVRIQDADEMIFGSASRAKLLMLGNAKLLTGRK